MSGVSIVIVAAGRGTRMGQSDKLFMEVAGLPLVGHTWRRFDQFAGTAEIIIVTRGESRSLFENLAKRIAAAKPWRIVEGGAERQDEVDETARLMWLVGDDAQFGRRRRRAHLRRSDLEQPLSAVAPVVRAGEGDKADAKRPGLGLRRELPVEERCVNRVEVVHSKAADRATHATAQRSNASRPDQRRRSGARRRRRAELAGTSL